MPLLALLYVQAECDQSCMRAQHGYSHTRARVGAGISASRNAGARAAMWGVHHRALRAHGTSCAKGATQQRSGLSTGVDIWVSPLHTVLGVDAWVP